MRYLLDAVAALHVAGGAGAGWRGGGGLGDRHSLRGGRRGSRGAPTLVSDGVGGGDRKDREDCSSVDSELGEHCGRDDGVKERKCWGVVCEDA